MLHREEPRGNRWFSNTATGTIAFLFPTGLYSSTNDTQVAPAPGAVIRKSGEPFAIPTACHAKVIYSRARSVYRSSEAILCLFCVNSFMRVKMSQVSRSIA